MTNTDAVAVLRKLASRAPVRCCMSDDEADEVRQALDALERLVLAAELCEQVSTANEAVFASDALSTALAACGRGG